MGALDADSSVCADATEDAGELARPDFLRFSTIFLRFSAGFSAASDFLPLAAVCELARELARLDPASEPVRP